MGSGGRSPSPSPRKARTWLSCISTSTKTPTKHGSVVEGEGRRCVTIAGDIGDQLLQSGGRKVMEAFGRIDILVNNAAEQHPQERIEDITSEQLERTFRDEHLLVCSS